MSQAGELRVAGSPPQEQPCRDHSDVSSWVPAVALNRLPGKR